MLKFSTKKPPNNLPYYWVFSELDSDQRVYVLQSVSGKKIPDFNLGSKIFHSRTQSLAKLQGLRLSYFPLLSSFQLIESSCNKGHVFRFSPVDEVWNTLTAVLNFGVLKRIQTPHSLLNFILGFRSR